MYTITVIVTVLYCYCHHIVPVIEITWMLIALNNNVHRQLILRFGKLMEETVSVFWVDLRYMLRSRLRVLLQGSWGMTGIPSVLLLFHCSYSEITVTVVPDGIAWFSAWRMRRGPGYVRDPPKVWIISPTNQF